MKRMHGMIGGLWLATATVLLGSGCGNFTEKQLCQPLTCSELEKECGSWADGCGSRVDCGTCSGERTCDGTGQCVSDCVSSTCEEMNLECGSWNDGCGETIECGPCPEGQTCGADGRCRDTDLVQEDRVSGCGGFENAGSSLFDEPLPYCAAEVLHYKYLAESQTLKVADARILLNCCGDHSMITAEVEGVYVFTETDAPEGGWGRCACMCVFDYVIEVQGVDEEVIDVRIERDVTDWPEGSGLVWEGQLDLTQGSGQVIIDDTPEDMWCTEP